VDNGEVTAELRCPVEQIGTRLVVRLIGELSLRTAPKVRSVLLKSLVEQPDAIVIDLAELVITEPTTVAVFSVVARQAAMWPGTPLLLCAPGGEVATLLARRPSRLQVYPTVAAALAVEPAPQPVVRDLLLPVGGAGRRAREVAADACDRWQLPHLRVSAALVAAELVANAAAHASTLLDLRLALSRHYLTIAVRDGSTDVPHLVPPAADTAGDPAAERGLLLVDAVADRWGSIATAGGRVVWATLRLRERAAS
jgi:anti-anti-sigma regulatory factor